MERIWNIIKTKWAEVSTKLGLMLGVASTIAPQYAQFDRRIAYVGIAASVLLVYYRETPSGDAQQ